MAYPLGFALILLSPLCFGLPWVRIGGAKGVVAKICFAYVAGYFLRLTLFSVVTLPMIILGVRFSTMSNAFTVIQLMVCAVSVWVGRDALRGKRDRLKPTVYDCIYCVVCVGLICLQLYLVIAMDPTYMTYDDAIYTVYSSDALSTDYMFINSPHTGLFSQIDYRILQTSLLFPAYIARVTGMPVAMVDRTFSYALNLMLAYACYIYMAEDLFRKRDDRFIFLILVSVIYIFGYHSHYSMTFRLLGPNQQGKAILAVTLVPFLFVLLRKWMARAYDWRNALLLIFLSNAACALSLMGTGYVVAIVVLNSFLSILRKRRRWKHLLYPLWACIIPSVYAMAYLLFRNYI